MQVYGVGPVPCSLAIVGPYVGPREEETGIPFSPGKISLSGRRWYTAGDELNRHLESIGLKREHIYLTNLHKEYRGKDYVYTKEDVDAAWPELQAEITRVKPKTIVTMGREVTRLYLGDVDISDVESIPWQDPILQGRVIFPITHVAAGMRNPELSPYVVRGFTELSEYLKGNIAPRKLFDDPIPEPVYEEITDSRRLDTTLSALSRDSILGLDTEGWPAKPFSLQFCYQAGRAYLIRATSRALLRRFCTGVLRSRPRLIYHSSLHDIGMLRALGIEDLSTLDFEDTMIQAYLLQIEPQGLKAGCLRHCGMKMSDYTDIVGDKANELARQYLTWLWDAEAMDYEQRCQDEFERRKTEVWTDKKGKVRVGRRITKVSQLPKTALHKAVERVLRSNRPRDLWLDQVTDIQVAGYNRLGPLPEATLDYISPDISIPYGCRDADGTTRLLPEYSRRIDAMGLRDVYNLELSTYPLIDRMQRIGLKPDLDHFQALSGALSCHINGLRETLVAETGIETFNANSGDQVAEFLFGTLGLEELKWTSGGRGSTNDKILEALEHEHPSLPVIGTIRSYREIYKLKHTFVDRIPDFVHRWPYDGRVHATFRTTRVVTGRLAASDPNVLAQPEHGLWAPEFKEGWVAENGHVLCAWDESQIELRGLAHLSQDAVLLDAFRQGIDLHATLAQRIFGVAPKDQDKHKHRLPAKAINFGIPMGMTNRGLSVELRKNGVDADEDTAQRWLDETLELYKGVKSYMERRIEDARRNGYVRCLSGRIRYIGGIRSRDDRVREEAERFAFSTPIQESAQFVMKRAEATVWTTVLPWFWKRGHWVEPLLQVHDCLKMECEEGLEQELHRHMVHAMTEAPKGFSVPLAVEGEWGRNMRETRSFDA